MPEEDRVDDSSSSKFPWDMLKADCLRTVCVQLGYHRVVRKSEMLDFLHDVEEYGLQQALEHSQPEEPTKAIRESRSDAGARKSNLKRKHLGTNREEEEVDGERNYNTRHKGLKRVRVSAPPLPRSTRKKIVKLVANARSAVPAKRGRGRPRNNLDVPVVVKRKKPANASKGMSSLKEVFYGVVLKKRVPDKEPLPDEDADGEWDDDENGIVVISNVETSSLGGSNKENELDAPAHGEDDTGIEPVQGIEQAE